MEVYQNILRLRCWSFVFNLYKAILKNKNRFGTSLPDSFSAWFLKKKNYHVISYWLTKFHAWFPLLVEILGNMCIVIICCPVCDIINFWISPNLIKPFFYIIDNPGQKRKISQERKELLTWNKKRFSSVLKGFQVSEIVSDPRVDL